MKVGVESPDQPDVIDLLRSSDAYMAALYPPESNHLVDVDQLTGPDVRFFVARDGNELMGCAALVKRSDDYAEIKRMFVKESKRGAGIGRLLLDAVFTEAAKFEVAFVRLETGVSQPEALGLYRTYGFRERPPFGNYRPDPLSLFMERRV